MIDSFHRHGAVAAFAVLTFGVTGVSPTAYAHVTLATAEARPGAYYKAVMQVPHGCAGSPTQTIRITIPEGVVGVKPMPKAGWKLDVTKGAYAKSYSTHHSTVKEGTKEIAWSGGNLSDDNYDEFTFASLITADLTGGQTIYFPTVQTCAAGENRWTEIPAAGKSPRDLTSPAPGLRLIANTVAVAEVDHSQMDHSKMDHGSPAPSTVGQSYKAGALTVSSPWTRATPGGAKIAGGYLSVTNNGTMPDRLVSISTPAAGRVEIHEMSMNDGVMKMRELGDGLTIKPGETVELKPGGFHMMFMDLNQPLKQGGTLKATLAFEKAGRLDVSFDVNAIGATKAK